MISKRTEEILHSGNEGGSVEGNPCSQVRRAFAPKNWETNKIVHTKY